MMKGIDQSISTYLQAFDLSQHWVEPGDIGEGEALVLNPDHYEELTQEEKSKYDRLLVSVETIDQVLINKYIHEVKVEYILEPYTDTSFMVSPFFMSLKRKEVYAEELLNEVGIGYWRWMPGLEEVYENDQWFTMLGLSKKDFLVQDEFFYGLLHPQDKDRVQAYIGQVEAGDRDHIHLNFRLRNVKGHYVHILAMGTVMAFDRNQKPSLIAGVHVDVTDLKETEARANLLSKAIEVSPVGLVLTNPEGLVTYVNHTFENLSGYTAEEVFGQRASDFLNFGDQESTYMTLRKRVREGKLWQGLLEAVKKNEDKVYINANISPIFNDQKQLTAFVAVVEDVTFNVTKENEMIERNTRLTKQKWILQELTRVSGLASHGDHPLHKMTEAVTKALKIEGASIFYFDEMDRVLVCQDAYKADEVAHIKYDNMNYYQHVNYFIDCIAGAQVVIQKDKPSLAYEDLIILLRGAKIYDSVHMPIWIDGNVKGILRAESQGHTWLSDEISFLRSVSDLITIQLESQARIRAQQIAEEAMTSKTNFLANISHEIKTPMNAIVGMTHLALQTDLTDQQLHYIQTIEASSQHLLVLMNDLLDYSKFEVGKIVLEHIEFDLVTLLKGLENMVRFKLEEQDVTFKWFLSSKTPKSLIGDPYRLNQILLNLVSNSIKFTKKGYIEILVDRLYNDQTDENHALLEFKVIDTGIGIEKNKQEKMFESFVQADTSTTREYGGTGLGLAISKALVELFGGQIFVESVVDKGSTFSFTILIELSIEPEERIESPKEDFDFKFLDVEGGIAASQGHINLYLKKLQQYLIYYHEDLKKAPIGYKSDILLGIGGQELIDIDGNRDQVFNDFKEEVRHYLSDMLNVTVITDKTKDDSEYLLVLSKMKEALNAGFINDINKARDLLNNYWPPLILWKSHEGLMKMLESYMFEDAVDLIEKMMRDEGVPYE